MVTVIGSPATWSSGNPLTATVLNGELEGQWTALWSPPRAVISSPNFLTIASQTTGTLHTTAGAGNLIICSDLRYEGYSGASMGSGTAGNWDGLVAPIAGIYEVHGEFKWVPSTSGQRGAILKQNATLVDVDCKTPSPSAGGLWGPANEIGCTTMQVWAELKMAANDKVQMFGTHNNGSTLDVEANWGALELVWKGNTA